MTLSGKTLLLMTALALGACAQGPLGGGGGFGGAGAGVDPLSAAPGTVGEFQTVIGDRVLFAVDQSTIGPEAQGILAAQAGWLIQNPEFSAVIEGHADEQGTREYNLALGARRASAVRDFLVSQGVTDGRLQTVTFGKERPIEICSDETCYAQNRRAVTVLSAGPGA